MKTKKKFNILSILLLIAFFAANVADFMSDFNYAMMSMSDGAEEANNEYDSPRGQTYYYDFFNVRPNHRYDIAARNT